MLHELAALEDFDIFCRQFKPFTITTLSLELSVPVRFDSCWIIRLDYVNGIGFFWKLDGQFAFSSPDCVCLANLVVTTRFHEIHETNNFLIAGFLLLSYWRRVSFNHILTSCYHVLITAPLLTVFNDRCCELTFASEALAEYRRVRKFRGPLFFSKHLSLYRKPYLVPVFRSADEVYELFNEEVFPEGLLKFIAGKTRFFLRISPSNPK